MQGSTRSRGITPPKKLMALYILKILQRETDIDNHLNQQDIIDLLQEEYSMIAERKAISRNIDALRSSGYEIEWNNGYYLGRRDFEDSELRLLIDSVIFSRHIKKSQRMALAEKLSNLSSRHFKSRIKHIRSIPDNGSSNNQIFYTIDILDEAISAQKKVSFVYKEYRADKKLHSKRKEPYIVSPYQIVAANNNYYLIANTDGYDNVSHYRLDRIFDIEVCETNVRPQKDVDGMGNGFSIPKHMAEHIYMFSGQTITADFLANLCVIDQIIDWFGTSIKIAPYNDDFVKITVKVNENAMYYWLLQYGEYVTLLAPNDLRRRVAATVKDLYIRYFH